MTLSTGFVLKRFPKNCIQYSLFRPEALPDGRSGEAVRFIQPSDLTDSSKIVQTASDDTLRTLFRGREQARDGFPNRSL
jgi:hypothetical protein